MKKIEIEFRYGDVENVFKITPCIQISFSSRHYSPGFALEFCWGKWAFGWKFCKTK